MCKRYSAAFEAQIVIERLQEAQSVPQIASEHGVHPNQLYRWKAQALTLSAVDGPLEHRFGI